VTDINQPLGDSVGTGLEVLEAVRLLKGEGPEDLQDLVLKLGMEVVRLAGVAGPTLSAKQTVEKHLKDGSALEKFKAMVRAQGGKTDWIDDPSKFPKAKFIRKLPARSAATCTPSTPARSPKASASSPPSRTARSTPRSASPRSARSARRSSRASR
jgi:thymidine phosphorylase